jgi:hypothetical protein
VEPLEIAIVFGSLALGLIVVLAAAANVGVARSSPVGPPNWDFTKSWATNITIIGAVFGAFFSTKIVAAPRYVSDPGYPMLSVLFAVLVAVAPLVFRAISKEKAVLTSAGTWDIQYQGNTAGFLLAMLLTLWAAFGQLTALGFLAAEVLAMRKVSASVPVGLLAILAIALAATIWYGWSTAKPLLAHQANLQAHADQLAVQMKAAGAVPPSGADPKRHAPLPGWRLL